jgi:hypothetical protein
MRSSHKLDNAMDTCQMFLVGAYLPGSLAPASSPLPPAYSKWTKILFPYTIILDIIQSLKG